MSGTSRKPFIGVPLRSRMSGPGYVPSLWDVPISNRTERVACITIARKVLAYQTAHLVMSQKHPTGKKECLERRVYVQHKNL